MKTIMLVAGLGAGVCFGGVEASGQVSSSDKRSEISKSEVAPPVAAPSPAWPLQAEKPWSARPNVSLESEGVKMDLSPGKFYEAPAPAEPRFIVTLPEGEWWLGRWRFDAAETEDRNAVSKLAGLFDRNEILFIDASKITYRSNGELKTASIKSLKKISKTEAEADFGQGPVILRLTKGFLVMEMMIPLGDKGAMKPFWFYFRRAE